MCAKPCLTNKLVIEIKWRKWRVTHWFSGVLLKGRSWEVNLTSDKSNSWEIYVYAQIGKKKKRFSDIWPLGI